MALSTNPELLIADEPTTALDVTIQAQILELMKSLREQNKMAIMLITHDLGVVAEMADEVVVMYAGKIVERAGVDRGSRRRPSLHPGCVFRSPSRRERGLEVIRGSSRSLNLRRLPFQARCPDAMPICDTGAVPGARATVFILSGHAPPVALKC